MPVEIVILAAGQGKRMRSELPKVLHTIGGKPLLQHLLETAVRLKPRRVHVIVGHGKDRVVETIEQIFSDSKNKLKINWVEQSEQRGTGHAVMQAMPDIEPNATVLILNGDVPLISLGTLKKIARPGKNFNLLVTQMAGPSGLGRIIRNAKDQIVDIVEERDATRIEKRICEVNSNCISARAGYLSKWLPAIGCNNAQGEYYLTDLVACAVRDGVKVVGIRSKSPSETLGVNSKKELCELERIYQARVADQLMTSGVTLRDPKRFDLRGTCKFGNECVVDINVILEGTVKIGKGVLIGPNTIIRNSTIGDNCVIESNSVIDSAVVGKNCNIGPFARIRPESVIRDEVRIGNFVEIKKSIIDKKSKVNHLSYVGDSLVGKNVNIGAGVITCNYDGSNKHQTVIGDDVFIGSDTQLVAPVNVGAGATIGAGSTITEDVQTDALAVSRARQRSVENWKRPRKK